MELIYDSGGDSAAVLVRGEIEPGGDHYKERVDADRFVRYDADDQAIEYEFLNVRRYGVRLDDIEDPEHRAELSRLFKEAGFQERDWGHPIPTRVIRRRDRAAG